MRKVKTCRANINLGYKGRFDHVLYYNNDASIELDYVAHHSLDQKANEHRLAVWNKTRRGL